MHARRQAASTLRNVEGDPLAKLFNVLGPHYQSRSGSYTPAIKAGVRKGDNAQKVIVEFVE